MTSYARPSTQPWRRGRVRSRSLMLGLLAGLALWLLVCAGAAWFLGRNRLPLLTHEALAQARQLWQTNGPADYDLEVHIRGRQPGVVQLSVRGGRVTHMTRDGVVPRQRRTWSAWTVESQFEMIALELEAAANPATGFGAPSNARVVQRALFDPQYGYPRHYQRHVLYTPLEVEWEVVRFVPYRSSKLPKAVE